MITTIECPSCGGQAKRDYDANEYGILEERITCSCGYYFEFLYGTYFEEIPGQVCMTWRHDDWEKRPCPEH